MEKIMEMSEMISYIAGLVRGVHREKFISVPDVMFHDVSTYFDPSPYGTKEKGMIVSDGDILIPAHNDGACAAWYAQDLVLKDATFYLILNGEGKIAALRFIGLTPDTRALEGFLEDLEPAFEKILIEQKDSWYNTSLTYRDDRYFDFRKEEG